MTFVAQPYEQFVDDLLTGLTGGMIREEHRFVGADETYSLAFPGANERFIKVFGQRNSAFVFFEKGIDYEYKTDDDTITWKPDGRLPDDWSYFYVNYYLQEGQSRLTDRNPGSVTTIMAETFGRELAVLSKQMELIYRSGFVDLAEGVSLDHVAALLGLSRKDARFAGGEVLFKRGTPAGGDITIPAGTLVSTDRGQNFETTDKRTLRRGQLSVTSAVRARVEGPAGRVQPGAVKIINRPILGIDSVTNEKETVFAAARETDEEFRRRIKGTLERAGKSSIDAIKYGLIEEIPEVTEGNIQVTEKPGVPGVVEIKFGWESGENPDLVRRIEASIFNSRAAGIRVVHNLSTRTKSVSAERTEAGRPQIIEEETPTLAEGKRTKQEMVHLPPEVLDEMPESVLQLHVEVFLSLAEKNLSASQKENIQDTVREIVKDYIEKLPMGADLIYNKLLGRIVQPDDISDADLIIGVKQESGKNENRRKSNLATAGRKAKINDPLKDVFVGLMEESVFMDIKIYVEPGDDTDTVPLDVTQALRDGVEDIVNEMFTEPGRELSRADLKDKIRDYITAGGLALKLIAGDSIVLDAEFEETGRVLKNTVEVTWEEYHVPVLRDLSIEEKGELDG
jgi:uncharacterized phage protein gp47/JayE